jgi:hypothetical protein
MGRFQTFVAPLLVFASISVCAASASDALAPFDSRPWLEDLAQARTAFTEKYADLEWEVFEHGIDLSAVFAETRNRIEQARSSDDVKSAFDDLARRFGDRHTRFDWPLPGPAESAIRSGFTCERLGYNDQMHGEPLASLIHGYVPLPSSSTAEFPAGTISVHHHLVGVIKIPVFMAQGFPALCEAAISALGIRQTNDCSSECKNKIQSWAQVQMTRDLESTLNLLKSSGAEFLLVDLAGNGGGNNWVDAAVRMVTAKRLRSTPMYFIKGQHWANQLSKKESELRRAAETASAEDRRFLLRLADTVRQRKRDAETPCDGEPLWSGKHPSCAWLGDGFYSGSLLQSADPEKLRRKAWAPLVFTPMDYPYREGVWRGPLLVLVDGYTGSAAELFAAELQDDHAAVIIGAPTIGAGCGHTDGGTPTTLKNSGIVLSLSDCVHIRPGGLNMASGVQPDVLVGLREDDSPRRRASFAAQKLPDALQRARRLAAQITP